MTTDIMMAAPGRFCTAWRKISIKGKRVGVLSAASMSPMQKSNANAIPKPNVPLRKMLNVMARGTMTAAFWISSAM